jgi:hypothetical protein
LHPAQTFSIFFTPARYLLLSIGGFSMTLDRESNKYWKVQIFAKVEKVNLWVEL